MLSAAPLQDKGAFLSPASVSEVLTLGPVLVHMQSAPLSHGGFHDEGVLLHDTNCRPQPALRKRLVLDVKNAGTQAFLTVMHKDDADEGHAHHGEPLRTSKPPSLQNGAVVPASTPADAHPLKSSLNAGFHSAFFEFNDPSSLSAYFVTTAIAKSHSAIWPRFVAGVLAGLFVVLGATFALVAAGGISTTIRAASPSIPKLLTGATFPIALLLILMVGGDLFTGNCMTVGVGWFTGHITVRQGVNVLVVSFSSNLCGCLFFDYFLAYRTQVLLAEPYLSWTLAVADGKLALDWGVVVLRAVGANTLVCVAIFMTSTSRQALGRFVIGWIPVLVFSVIGFEHVVADMAFIPIAMMYGGTEHGVQRYVAWNLVPATLGNLIGGLFLVGGFLTYLYLWKDRRCTTLTSWLRFNLVPDVSMQHSLKEIVHQFFNDLPIGKSAS